MLRGPSFGSWIGRQIRGAQERGAFDDLPGTGKPIPPDGDFDGAMDCVVRKAEHEGLETSVLLPPSLTLMKECEDLPARLDRERDEDRVLALVQPLDARIRDAHRRPQVGPPLRYARSASRPGSSSGGSGVPDPHQADRLPDSL